MLRKRLIASACFIIPVLVLLWLDVRCNFGLPGLWIVLTTAVVSVFIAGEFHAMVAPKTGGVNLAVLYVGTALCHLVMIFPEASWLPSNLWTRSCGVLFCVYALSALVEVFRYGRAPGKPVERLAFTMLGVFYCGWLLSYIGALRVSRADADGVFAMFSVLFIIKMSDTGAYFVGKQWGRRKLAPKLSPGKTVEGLFGGLVAGGAAACLAFAVARPAISGVPQSHLGAVVGYAVSITLVGVLGDLAESLIKREMGVKDSSNWLPGLGGVMDTTDSVIVAAPVAYAWWSSGVLS